MLASDDMRMAGAFKASLLGRSVRPVETIVFGSRARGDHREESDLDVLVLVEKRTPQVVRIVRDCAWEVGFESGRLIQTVVLEHADATSGPQSQSLLMKAVRAEGVPV